jgi:hypothetical protein
MSKKRRADWVPTMEQRSSLEGRQLKCLIASEGHLWMRGYFDRLPPIVRRRLAESDFNICTAGSSKLGGQHQNQKSPTILP